MARRLLPISTPGGLQCDPPGSVARRPAWLSPLSGGDSCATVGSCSESGSWEPVAWRDSGAMGTVAEFHTRRATAAHTSRRASPLARVGCTPSRCHCQWQWPRPGSQADSENERVASASGGAPAPRRPTEGSSSESESLIRRKGARPPGPPGALVHRGHQRRNRMFARRICVTEHYSEQSSTDRDIRAVCPDL